MPAGSGARPRAPGSAASSASPTPHTHPCTAARSAPQPLRHTAHTHGLSVQQRARAPGAEEGHLGAQSSHAIRLDSAARVSSLVAYRHNPLSRSRLSLCQRERCTRLGGSGDSSRPPAQSRRGAPSHTTHPAPLSSLWVARIVLAVRTGVARSSPQVSASSARKAATTMRARPPRRRPRGRRSGPSARVAHFRHLASVEFHGPLEEGARVVELAQSHEAQPRAVEALGEALRRGRAREDSDHAGPPAPPPRQSHPGPARGRGAPAPAPPRGGAAQLRTWRAQS